jgi:hypothetical protein
VSSVVAAPEFVQPTYSWVPPHATSGGTEAVELAASAGLQLDPWQAWSLDGVLAERDDGGLAAFETGIIVSRQNGKGAILEALALNWLFLEDVELVLWSAHEFKTAAEAFRRMRLLLQGAPDLWPLVERITTANGDEAIELTTGQRIKFVARSKASGRGFTGDKIILDEAYDLDGDQIAALLPTLATVQDPQLIYTSSAGMADSAVLRAVRDRGRAGGDPGLCWLEWCALPAGVDDRGLPVYDLDDRREWRRANPGTATARITEDFIANERRAMIALPDKFQRERLGVWDEPNDAVKPITSADWAATRVPVSTPTAGAPRFFITIGGNGAAVIAAAATAAEDGRPHVELADQQPGTDWLPARLAELAENWPGALFGAGKAGPVAGLVEADALPVDIELLPAAEMAQACVHHAALSREGKYTHTADAITDISREGAVSKPAGDGLWVWNWRASTALAPIAAYTGALWLLEKHREDDYAVEDSFW